MNLLYLNVVSDMLNNVDIASLAIKAIRIIIIIIGIKVIIGVAGKLISEYFNKRDSLDRKSETLVVIIKSTLKYLVYFIGALMILQEVGIDTKSIIAAAGIGGVAIGFGAKSLVEDVVSGFFIIFEGQYSIGDHVELEGYEGVVEDVQLRTSSLRDYDGELHIIPNGNVTIVTNRSKGSIRAEIDIKAAYGQDIEFIKKELRNIADQINQDEKDIINSGPYVTGVAKFGYAYINFKMYALVNKEDKLEVEAKMREGVLKRFPENEIELKKA